MQIFDKIQMYFQFPFVRYAMVVGVLIALCASVLGVTLVLKRFSFIGDGLSHVAFGSMCLAGVLQLSQDMLFVLPVTVLCAVLLLSGGRRAKLQGDASIAMLSVGSLGLGYLLLSLFTDAANMSGDVCTALFGSTSILTLSQTEVWLCVGLSILVLVAFVLFYHKIFAVTFDETFAEATGMRARLYNQLLAVVIAVIIVLAMNLVGSLLISALIVFPALSGMRVFKSFRAVTVFAACMSVGCAALGILVSILAGTPVGPTIVAADMAVFGVCTLIGGIKR